MMAILQEPHVPVAPPRHRSMGARWRRAVHASRRGVRAEDMIGNPWPVHSAIGESMHQDRTSATICGSATPLFHDLMRQRIVVDMQRAELLESGRHRILPAAMPPVNPIRITVPMIAGASHGRLCRQPPQGRAILRSETEGSHWRITQNKEPGPSEGFYTLSASFAATHLPSSWSRRAAS